MFGVFSSWNRMGYAFMVRQLPNVCRVQLGMEWRRWNLILHCLQLIIRRVRNNHFFEVQGRLRDLSSRLIFVSSLFILLA